MKSTKEKGTQMKVTKNQVKNALSYFQNSPQSKEAKSKFELYSESEKMSKFFDDMDKKIYGMK